MRPEGFFPGLKGDDPPDPRDWKISDRLSAYRAVSVTALPERVDLKATCPAVMDQKTISGCVGWAGVACYNQNQFVAQGRPKRRPAVLSAPFAYRECRALDERGDPAAGIPPEPGSLEHDWGTYVRNFWKVAKNLGAPLQSLYPPKFGPEHEGRPGNDFVLPPNSVYRKQPARYIYNDADDRQALSYLRVEGQGETMRSLADGYAVQMGFTIFRSFYGTGGPRFVIPMPGTGDAPLGGHSVYIVGYDRTQSNPYGFPYWECMNSWAKDAHLRDDGTRVPTFILPFDYHRWVKDAWTGRAFER